MSLLHVISGLVYMHVSDYVCTLLLQTILVVKCDYMYNNKCKHSLAVVYLTINILFSNYQHLLVIFTAVLSPTISSTHY